MSHTIKFKCQIGTTDPACPLSMEILFNSTRIYQNPHVTTSELVEYDIDDDYQGENVIQWVMSGKTDEHTIIDDSGNILKDALLVIDQISLDDIYTTTMVESTAIYNHTSNGHGPSIDDKFYGLMGCNGVLTFKFTTPFYMWMLSNM